MKRLLIVFSLTLSGCHFPKAISSFYAKEVCSCLFVIKQSEKYCHQLGRQIIPNWKTKIDMEQKNVTAWGAWHKTEAHFLSQREGCQIIK